MTNEEKDDNIKENPYEQNYNSGIQGIFRRTILDLNLLKYAINSDKDIKYKKKNLVVTCLDLITEYKFTIDNEIIICNNEKEFITKIQRYLKIDNVYLSRCAFGSIDKFSYYT
jgi:hypothetical protein